MAAHSIGTIDGTAPGGMAQGSAGGFRAGTAPATGPGAPTWVDLEPSGARVAVVHLGNAGGLGTTRRVGVWKELLGATGAEVIEMNLLRQHRRVPPSPVATVGALRGRVTLESVLWSPRTAARALRDAGADVVVFVTARAFHPDLADAVPRSILDFQDLFSRSYRGRAAVDRRPGAAAAWRALAWATERFERRDHRVRTVAAGWAEAAELGATWLPNTLASSIPAPAISDHVGAPADVLFFGKLSALPNLDALRRLAELWPVLLAEVPEATCLLGGSGLNGEVSRLAARHGWRVQPDFADVNHLCEQARVAVAPLRHANGIQNKVLEAAAAGLPQVVSPQAMRGMAPGFPALVADDPASTVAAIAALLASPARRLELALEAHAHVMATYGVGRWVHTVHDLVVSPA